jgi:hypothetical protein
LKELAREQRRKFWRQGNESAGKFKETLKAMDQPKKYDNMKD